jgi:hypothetical protein
MKNLKYEGLKTLETKARSIKGGRMLFALVLAAAMLVPHPVAAHAASVYATINGGGTAEMQSPGVAQGTSLWGAGITLYSDGSATGEFTCVDQNGDPTGGGNIFGHVTSWFIDGNGFVSLNVVGKFLAIPGGHPQDVAFIVRIQKFGGAGVGHWTLEAGGTLFCVELLTSGQIVIRYA